MIARFDQVPKVRHQIRAILLDNLGTRVFYLNNLCRSVGENNDRTRRFLTYLIEVK